MNRRVKVLTNGFISVLRMEGPIVQPILIDENTVYEMVRRGYPVFEQNRSLNKEIRLTLQNFHDPKRFTSVDSTTIASAANPAQGKPLTGSATPATTISTGGPVVPPPAPPAMEVKIVEESAKPLTKAEKKAKRREEEKAKKEAAAKAAAEATAELVEETPAAEVAVETTDDSMFTTGEAVVDISEE